MNWDRRSYSRDMFKRAWLGSSSIKECSESLGLASYGGTYKSLKLAAYDLGLDTSHMDSGASKVRPPIPATIPLSEILIENSTYSSTSGLRGRLIREGLLEEKCSAPFCPVPETQTDPWTGEPASKTRLTLDHINGINTDNRIENLRILCSYCHSHTPTYCGSNRKKFNFCSDCGANVSSPKAEMCRKCSDLKNSKLRGFTAEELISGVEKYGYLAYGRIIGVSDNGIRKYLRRIGVDPLPKRKRV